MRQKDFSADKKLKPFQKEAVKKMHNFLVSEIKGCYNACEPGLGKTIQTIVVLNSLLKSETLGHFGKVLIICPSVMKYTWERELLTWSEILTSIQVVETGKKKIDPRATHVIMSYEIASSRAEELGALKFDALILDEAHYVKSRKALRTKNILNHIWPQVTYRIALSGTPFTQSVLDGFTLFHALCPEKFKNYYHYADRYLYRKMTPWGPKWEGGRNIEELSKLIREAFFIRYLKEEVEKELPEKIWQAVRLPKVYAAEPPKEEIHIVNAEVNKLVDEMLIEQKGTFIPPNVSSLRHVQGLKKIVPVVQFVEDLLDQEIPIVLFAYHLDVIASLKESLQSRNPGVITGTVDAKARDKSVQDFQSGKTNLIILQMVAGGIGITLTRASTAVFAELDYRPSVLTQCIDRLHRIGQTKCVHAYYFVVDTSIEERIIDVVMRKVKVFKQVLDTEPVEALQ